MQLKPNKQLSTFRLGMSEGNRFPVHFCLNSVILLPVSYEGIPLYLTGYRTSLSTQQSLPLLTGLIGFQCTSMCFAAGFHSWRFQASNKPSLDRTCLKWPISVFYSRTNLCVPSSWTLIPHLESETEDKSCFNSFSVLEQHLWAASLELPRSEPCLQHAFDL